MDNDQMEVKYLCEPVRRLISALQQLGFQVTDIRLSDYHFREMAVKMEGVITDAVDTLEVDGIVRHSSGTFICNCHWSTLKVIQTTE